MKNEKDEIFSMNIASNKVQFVTLKSADRGLQKDVLTEFDAMLVVAQ